MQQSTFKVPNQKNLVSLKEASHWASLYLNRNITTSNISYLIQYGVVMKYGENGNPLISIEELKHYYDSFDKSEQWKRKLGDDLNWRLSFSEYKESERTKHVHRLHPYKGKFIPQLVEYFLDSHTDDFKRESCFHRGDIVLDPFCGSGTTLVQANELGMHAIGVDVSAFNAMISNAKVARHDIPKLRIAIGDMTAKLDAFQQKRSNQAFEKSLLAELAAFNARYFPSPEYRRKVRQGEINEKEWTEDKERLFSSVYEKINQEIRN